MYKVLVTLLFFIISSFVFSTSYAVENLNSNIEIVLARPDDWDAPMSQWTFDGVVEDIQEAQAKGAIVGLSTQNLFFDFPESTKFVPHVDCQFYNASSPVVYRSVRRDDWLMRGAKLMYYHPIISTVDLVYIQDEINVHCANVNDMQGIINAFKTHFPNITRAYGLAMTLDNRDFGAYLLTDIQCIKTWNYNVFDFNNMDHPFNASNKSLETYADILGDVEILWVLPLWCNNNKHRNVLGWTEDCSYDTSRLTEAYFNQLEYIKAQPYVTTVFIFIEQGYNPSTLGYTEMSLINPWIVDITVGQ